MGVKGSVLDCADRILGGARRANVTLSILKRVGRASGPVRCLLGAALLVPLGCSQAKPPPSVLLVLIDTLRPDYLGCYGFQAPVSPSMDRLGSESLVFDHCYAPAPWTKPSIASLFTSLYPLNHGVVNHEGMWKRPDAKSVEKGVLGEKAVTLAELLQARGYRTGAFVANPWITPEYGFAQGFDRFDARGFYPPAREVLSRAEAWMDSIPADRPFFAYVHLMDVHGPYRAPLNHDAELARSPRVQSDVALSASEWEAIPEYLRKVAWAEGPPGRYVRNWRIRYAAGVRHEDDELGAFLERLRKQGVLDRALLVVTADHGEELYDHGGWNHGGTLYEEQLHVPLLIRPRGGARPPRRVETTVSLLDLLPTIVTRAGGTPPPAAAGESLVPILAGETVEEARILLAMAPTTGPEWISLRAGKAKLILNQETLETRVFDLHADPGEATNLAKSRPDLAHRLTVALEERVRDAQQAGLFELAAQPPSEETRELLQSLGYTN